ncbi:MAG: hypothetical protein H0V79_01655 [Actinobacteria bacterium]|nr:hypothetical protein [Actinomycetota bacterium]
MFNRRILLAISTALALVLVSGASGEPIDGYTATGSPSHVKPSTQNSYTIALTNDPLSLGKADKAKIGIPLGFVVAPASVQASASAAGDCVASTWVADGTLVADGKINLKRPTLGGGANSRLCPGATLTVVFSATSAAADGTYIWATELLRGDAAFVLSGSQPTVQVDGTPPVVTISSHPANPSNVTSPSFAFSATEPAAFQCRLDNAPYAACTSPVSYSAGHGPHTFTVRATDAAGNTGQASYSWTIDTVSPIATITQRPPAASASRSATFAFSANEPSSFLCKLDGGGFVPCTSPTSYGEPELIDGAHTFIVKATDAAGNTGETSYSWTIDTAPPTVTITEKPNDPSGVKSATFRFSASEAASFLCDLDGRGFASCSSPATYNNLSDSIHIFKVKATDAAGNTGAEARYDWLVEANLPVVTLTEKPDQPSEYASASATFAFKVDNTPGKSPTFECKLDGSDFATCSSPKIYLNLSEGPHTFRVRATGTGGTGPETVYTWTVDTVGPTSAITQRPADPTNSRSASFTVSANEPASFQCKLDDAAFASCAPTQIYNALADGRHTFVVRGIDGLSNVGPETAYAWTIETRAPAVAVTSGPAALTNSTSAGFSFSADEPSTFQCNLDGSGFEPCSSPASYAGLSDGGHAFAVRATDAAGNVGAASASWTIDATAPQTTIDSAPALRTTARSAAFTFSASESAIFQCRLDGGSFAPCGSPSSYAGLASGVHRFAVRAIDAAGNVDATPAGSEWTVAVVTRTVARSALFAPAAGARVTRPPLLRWRPVRGASYYNVQLYRAGRKVLSAWPTRTRLQLRAQWRFNGRAQRLEPGVYRWYVWPGRGQITARRYGKVLGSSTFVVRSATARR